MTAITIDRALLSRSASYVDGSVREQMFHLPVGDDRCWADLVAPVGELMPTGFVVVHAYGLELLWLHRIERQIAHALAGEGYPVLLVHRRGFGDSTGGMAEASIARQTEDILAACDRLIAETGITRVGLVAARFGSLIAASVTQVRSIDRLMLMNPVLDGAAYFRGMIRDMNVISLAMGMTGRPDSVEQGIATIEAEGMLDVLGQPIYRSMYEEASASDVRGILEGFTGDALLCQISKRSAVGRDLQSLSDAIDVAGGRPTIDLIREPSGAAFGHSSQVRAPTGTSLREALGPVQQDLADAATGWMHT